MTDGAEVTTYTWDAADRLVAVHAPSSTVQYAYDADGRRVQQTTTVNGLSSTVAFLWDEASLYGDVILETDESGNTLAAYVLGGAELLSQNRGGTIRYYLQDAQSSTRTLTDASGNVTDTYAYTAFGETLSHSGASDNPYLYTGQQFDALTGLYSLRARYYDPALGRFLSRDVYPYALDNLLELNRYLYGLDNPVNALDPTGRQAFVEYSELNESAEERAQPIAATIQKTNLELAQESGAWGEEAFARVHPDFVRQQYFATEQGARIVDFFDKVNRIAHEIKTGYQSLSSTISQEIAKDVELLANGSVREVVWHFYPSPINGSIGGSQPLLDLLAQEGIIVEILP